MKKKILYRVAAWAGIAVCSLSLFFVTPQTSITAQAAGGDPGIAQPQADVIYWVYLEADGKMWKRLWNSTSQEWLTEWIFVRDLP